MRTLQDIQPGMTLGRYEFLVPIAEGGMATVYRATRIVNFAQVGLGGVGGILAVNLFLHQGWPYFLCLPLGLLGAFNSATSRAFSPACRIR